jgi:hypothetical protein
MRSRPLPASLAGSFTTAAAYAAGVSRESLRGPRVRRLHSGVYVARDAVLDLVAEIRAARLVLPPHTLVTGVTALWCFGVEVASPRPLQFLTTHPHQVRRPGLQVSRTDRLPPARGLLVCPEHAFAVAARRLDLLQLVTAGDWLVRRSRTTPARLTAYARSYRGAGAPRARRAAALVRERVDSPRETALRLCLVLAGLPEPECNVTLGTEDRPIGRVDLLLELYKLILEYEGDQHRTDRWQWNIDIGRVEEFSAEGYRVLRVTAEHMRRPRALVLRVHAALVAGGYRGPAPTFSAEWSELFE